jgi:hypothetical protein
MISQFVAARKVGTPLIAIRTPDPALTVASIQAACPTLSSGKPTPIFLWDSIGGIIGLNETACQWAKAKLSGDTTNATSAIEAGATLPEGSIFLLSNAQHGVAPEVNKNWVQAVWNLRQPYKATRRTLVMLCPDINLPAELAQDVMLLDEPLPDESQLEKIVRDTLAAVGEMEPDAELIARAVDATTGLAAFPAEQVCAMSLYRDQETRKIGLRLDELWSRKYSVIESTPGLSVWRGGEHFAQIGGYTNLKSFLIRIVEGKRRPRCIVFLDEIEKLFGGGLDTSGTSQSFLASILSYMEDNDASGIILLGPPGAGKSQFAKSMGTQATCPTIAFDLNGMKNSLVGESEARIRQALKVVTAVGQGKVFFIATCNRLATLPPELRRRFKAGTFFVDLPTAAEREAIWDLYLTKYGVSGARPEDTDWTGAEIKQCVTLADDLGCSLVDAAQYIVPVARSAEREIAELRAQAHGRFINASQPGFYRHESVAVMQAASRAIESIPEE